MKNLILTHARLLVGCITKLNLRHDLLLVHTGTVIEEDSFDTWGQLLPCLPMSMTDWIIQSG